MVEAGEHSLDSAKTANEVPGLIDVYIPPKKTVWAILVISLISFVILQFSSWGEVIRGFRIPLSILSTSRLTWYALCGVVALAVGSAISGVIGLWRRRIRSVLTIVLKQHPDAPIEELIERTVSQRRSSFPQMYLQAIARLLPTFGRVGITIRNCPPKHVTPVEPITVTFEPRALDEADEAFVALENATEAQHATQSVSPERPQNHTEVIPEIRRMKRNIAMAGGRVVMAFIALSFLGCVFLSYVLGQIGILLMMGIPFFFLLFFIPGGGWQGGRKQWLLVPGGVVIRKGRWFGDQCTVHLIARETGVLMVHRASRYQWTVCAANKESHHEATVTSHEATLLLRAWLSPLPPPPLEQLSDLV